VITIRGLAQINPDAFDQIKALGLDLDKALIAKPAGEQRQSFDVCHKLPDGSRLVPWYWLQQQPAVVGISRRQTPETQWVTRTDPFHGELRDNQKDPVADLLHALRLHNGAMLRADCGVGKTVMGLWVANELGAGRVAILVDQTDLADQWVNAIQTFMPDASYTVMGGGRAMTQDTDARFRVIVGQSLWRQDWASDPMVVDLLLVDEAHVFAAPCFFRSLTNLCFNKSIALTATPDRRDGLEWVVGGVLGTTTVEAAARLTPATIYRYPIQTVVDHTDYYMAWCRRNKGMTTRHACSLCPHFAGYPTQCGGHLRLDETARPPEVIWTDKLNYTPFIQQVVSDPVYNDWLVTVLSHLMVNRRHVIVFGQFQDQLLGLHAAFETRHPGLGGLYFGRHAKAGRKGREQALDKPATFCTYGVAMKGLNVPWKDAAVFASPLRDTRQPRGRIERVVEGKAPPIIIDPVHINSVMLRALARRRLDSYTQAQCHVIDYPGL